MRIRIITVLSAMAIAMVGLAPAASATCTDDPTGTFSCLETVVCAPLTVLNRVGIDAHCVA